MASSEKRAKVNTDSTKTLIYIIPQKIQKRRLDILVTRSREKGLPITDIFWYVSINTLPVSRPDPRKWLARPLNLNLTGKPAQKADMTKQEAQP